MCSTETILGKIVEKIVDTVFQSVGRHVGFMLRYKQNLKNLDDEENNLQKQRDSVQGKVDEDKHEGKAINDNVLDWLKDADETRQGVVNFRDENAGKENMLCFNFSCPNFTSRYRLSKEAKDKVVHVKHVTEEGGKIENGTVSHLREAPPEVVFRISNGNYECFHSRDKVFKDIVKALKDPEVNMIGVYGTGGVGKTTTVTKVAEEVKKDGTFNEVVIAVVSQDANVIKIQEQLAERLNLTLSEKTEGARASRLWNRLDNGKKNLIIMDDVWQELDLNKIGIPITDGNKSCKVVLTSRKRDVWNIMDVKDFRIEILSEGESWALFKKKVGNYVDAHHELCEIARAVCEECQGLPVAINAIGAALKGKGMYAWEDALDKLKNSMLKDVEGIDRQVYASLEWSYDQLDSKDARSCFLLCCLFPEDAEIKIDDLVRYYMTGRTFHGDRKPDSLEKALNRVRTVVGTLISCCLLLEENDYEDVVKMHDVVRDVAISIAKAGKYSFLVKHGVKDWPEKATYEQCSVISIRPHDMLEFPDELVCPELHTLRLDCTDNDFQRQVPDRFFSGTENLTVLDLNRVTISPILPASLANFAKLQMLCLNECKLGDIAILKDLKDHLEILSLRRSDIEVLPPEVGELTRLRVLDMDGCDKLEVIPEGVISKLLCLEELYMPWEFSQWEGTRTDGTGRDISCVSLNELTSLTHLTTLLHVRIPDPALLPKDVTIENLVRFDIAVGESTRFSIYRKDSTGVLQLEKIHVANGLESLLGKPKPKDNRSGLYPSKSFFHLTDLSVTDCSWKYLFSPSSARGLVGLKRLVIERCMDMEGVIGNEGEEDHEDIIPITFSLLNDLTLKSLPNLKSFYPKKEKTATSSESCSAHDTQTVLFTNKVAFPVIEQLNIESVPKVTQIWYKQNFLIPEKETESSFNQLWSMVIQRCDKLINVVGGCPKIESIVTEKQKGLEVDNYVTRFPWLMTLVLENLLNLESFCSHSIRCEAQPLFDHQVAFPKLDLLVVKSCIGVREVFHVDGLEVGEIQECVGSLIHVRNIELESLPKLTCLWNKDPHGLLCLQNLEFLTIKDCPLLRNLLTASVAKALGGLKALYLRSCSTMEEVVFATDEGHEDVIDDEEIVFPKLEWLILKDLSNLKSF